MTFIIESLGSGGAERVLSVIVNELVKKHIECNVIVFANKSKSFYKLHDAVNIKYLDFNYKPKGFFSKFIEQAMRVRKLRAEALKTKSDVFISFMSHCNIRSCISLFNTNTNLICCEHAHYYAVPGLLYRFLKNLCYKFIADKVTVLTDRDFDNYPSFLKKKIIVLKNPLGVTTSTDDIYTIKKRFDILTVGRLDRMKGIDRLLVIFKRICDMERFSDWQLSIAGEGEEELKLKELANELKIADRINWLGNIKDMESLYKQSSIFVMTSRSEGLPMVLGEAMQCGLPVIAYDCPTGPREFIKNNINGFLIDDDDSECFILKLTHLMDDASERERMGRDGRNMSLTLLPANIVNNWISLFGNVC